LAVPETANGPELSAERSFKYAENEILGFIVHGGLLSIRLRIRLTHLRRSVNNYYH
jgi:hypothetical protein